jgi:hypothetical protein
MNELIAQTQGFQQNKQVQLAQTQRINFQQHHMRFTNNNNATAVNNFTWPENSAVFSSPVPYSQPTNTHPE